MKIELVFLFFALIGSCYNSEDGNKTTTTTTTPEPVTTTVTPLPPKPEVAELLSFEIMNSTDKTVCSMFNFTATITIEKLNNTQTVFKNVIPLNKLNTKMNNDSSCELNSTKLVLNIATINESFVLSFELNHKKSHYELALIKLKSTSHTFIKNDTSIHVEDNKSYLCLNHPEFKLVEQTENPEKHEVYLSATDLRIDAFRSKEDQAGFRNPQECQYDFPNNDFVPLAVGCALISLVFIVLIAYIVGRKRSRRLTYQSV